MYKSHAVYNSFVQESYRQSHDYKHTHTSGLNYNTLNVLKYIEPNTLKYIEPNALKYIEPNTLKYIEPNALKYIEPNTLKYIEPNALKYIEPNTLKYIEPNALKYIEPNALKYIEPNTLSSGWPRHTKVWCVCSIRYVCTHTVCESGYVRTYTLRSLVKTHQYAEEDRLAKQVVKYTIHASHYSDAAPANSCKVCEHIIISITRSDLQLTRY